MTAEKPATEDKPKKKREDIPYQAFVNGLIRDYTDAKPKDPDPKELAAVSAYYSRWGKETRDIFNMAKQDPDKARQAVEAIGKRMETLGLSWNLRTVVQWFHEWVVDPERYENETKNPKRR